MYILCISMTVISLTENYLASWTCSYLIFLWLSGDIWICKHKVKQRYYSCAWSLFKKQWVDPRTHGFFYTRINIILSVCIIKSPWSWYMVLIHFTNDRCLFFWASLIQEWFVLHQTVKGIIKMKNSLSMRKMWPASSFFNQSELKNVCWLKC